MSETKRRLFPTIKLVAAAMVLGALAGAGAVYLSGGGGPVDDGAVADAACAAKGEIAAALAPLATGEVAALTPQETPRGLGWLAFEDDRGEPVTLADFAGKTVLVNLWATWCAPCREEMPALDELQERLGGQDFEVVAVNIDTGDKAKATDFLAEIGVDSLGFWRDDTMGVFNDLKREGLALGLPVTLVVGESGCLLASMNGPAEWASEDAVRLIEAAMNLQNAST